ncbi:hypothetical protein INT44_002519 [Umbelopsis vinacea]|uniref:Uncharacterized protein n=1 Tax=Umbelopsis vinacea TaxID=44442 RepID=A0A8H7PDW1_9FUNG|nr:hypothetical protein INT44_002519 [Umbelopsis vinacea]
MLGYPDSAEDQPAYPYGLSICLDDETLAKLGITELPKVGTVMQLTALVEVCSVSQYENQDGADNSLSLQITDMELAAGNGAEKPIANRIYGE